MFSKIPAEIKPTDTSAKITYANAFDYEFFLLLRERRSTSLSLMQDASLEVESNIVASQKIKEKVDRRKQSSDPLGPSSSENKMEKMSKMLDSLSTEMSKLKDRGQLPVRGKGSNEFAPINPNIFLYRRNNPQAQILQRDRNPAEEQTNRAPFRNVVLEEEEEFAQGEGEAEENINCMEDEV